MKEEELKEITNYAGLFFSPKEIILIMGIDVPVQNFLTEGNEIFDAYQRGKLLQISKFRASVIKLSEQGSSAAQVIVNNLIDKQRVDEYSG